jgi:hypothetical protein
VGRTGFHPAQVINALGPGDHMQVDLLVHLPPSPDGYVAILHIIDVFTGFTILRPLKDEHATTAAQQLFEIFCLIGFPRILQSDNGPQFVSDVHDALCRIAGIEKRLISAYNPRADGKVERSVGTTTTIIKKMLHGTDVNWPLFLPFAQLCFNWKISTLTGSSPFALMFGRSPNEFQNYTDNGQGLPPPRTLSLDEWRAHQERILAVIYPATDERIKRLSANMRKAMNRQRRVLIVPIPAGAVVMLKDVHRKNKFEPKYVGPYSVVRRAQNGAYVLRDATGDILDRHVPLDQLKIVSRKPLSLPNDQSADNIYLVRKIVDHRGQPGNYEYLVDWKGDKQRTWEPERNILDYDCVKDYWEHGKLNTPSQLPPTSSDQGGVPIANAPNNELSSRSHWRRTRAVAGEAFSDRELQLLLQSGGLTS